jgi:hypothetical protein
VKAALKSLNILVVALMTIAIYSCSEDEPQTPPEPVNQITVDNKKFTFEIAYIKEEYESTDAQGTPMRQYILYLIGPGLTKPDENSQVQGTGNYMRLLVFSPSLNELAPRTYEMGFGFDAGTAFGFFYEQFNTPSVVQYASESGSFTIEKDLDGYTYKITFDLEVEFRRNGSAIFTPLTGQYTGALFKLYY